MAQGNRGLPSGPNGELEIILVVADACFVTRDAWEELGMTGEKGTSSDGKKNTGKGGTRGKNEGDKNGGKAKKGQS